MTLVEHISQIQSGLKDAGLLNAVPVAGVWCPHTRAAFEAFAYRHPQFQAHEGKMMPKAGDARIAELCKVKVEPVVEVVTPKVDKVEVINDILVRPKKAERSAKPE